MEKTFIDRLTDEQIKTFLKRHYPMEKKYTFTFFKEKKYICVSVDENMGDSLFNFTLYEYNTIGVGFSKIWIKYLYEIFGEEYKNAYLNECAKIFD